MPNCGDDGYPMVPVRDIGAGRYAWGCTNPWHPRVLEACPACGDTGHPKVSTVGNVRMAACPACRVQWVPFSAEAKPEGLADPPLG